MNLKKEISFREMACIKRSAKNIRGLVARQEKITAEIDKLNEEFESNQVNIDAQQAGIKANYGFGIMDLVKRVIKEGQTAADYIPNDELVEWDEEKRVYRIKEVEEDTQETVGSDYDIDLSRTC